MEDTASSVGSSDCEMMDDIMLFPMSDVDDANDADISASESNADNGSESENEDNFDNDLDRPKAKLPQESGSKLPLRLRRRSKAEALGLNWLNDLVVKTKTKSVNVQKPRFCFSAPAQEGVGSPKLHWFQALRKAQSMEDPWEKFHLEELTTERAIRHRYNVFKKTWSKDDIVVKMDDSPFNKGAMRECFRLKKLSKFTHNQDWKRAGNYVAKRYMEEVERDVYFEDVRLQMDAKLWAEEYDRHKPPKKIDIMQMYIVEMIDRPGQPLYHLEHYIEGDYVKFNSNSGFVEESVRLTPQAFSHFTFERSGHQLIVVDIQGVGNLWTDPQIHTADGEGYGDGNLGPKGMALFFHSHVCNSICHSLELTKFDLSIAEEKNHERFLCLQKNATTRVRGHEEHVVSASPKETMDLTAFLARQRKRTMSGNSNGSSNGNGNAMFYMEEDEEEEDDERESSMDPLSPDTGIGTETEPMSPTPSVSSTDGHDGSDSDFSIPKRKSRVRFISETEHSDSGAGTMTEEDERIMRKSFHDAMKLLHRPSSVAQEMNLLYNKNAMAIQEDSTLGKIHHEMAKYYEIGRFSVVDNEVDWESAMYHEQHAADLGVMEAVLTMSNICLGMQHDVLVNCTVEQTEENINRGVEYMLQAAHGGSRPAMIYIAQAYETGNGLGTDRTRSWKDAMRWYEAAVERTQNDESGEFDAVMDNPVYVLQAKMAELYLGGEYGLEKDPSTAGDLYNEAAEGAMAAMKGRMANKYYMLAEEAYGQVEE